MHSVHFWAGISGDSPGRVLNTRSVEKAIPYSGIHSLNLRQYVNLSSYAHFRRWHCADDSLRTVTQTEMYVAHSHSEMKRSGIEHAWRKSPDEHCADGSLRTVTQTEMYVARSHSEMERSGIERAEHI